MEMLRRHGSFLQRMAPRESIPAATDHTRIDLPPPSPNDVMCKRQQELLQKKGLSLSYDLQTVPDISDEWFNRLLESARILQLTETEWYFMEDGDNGPYSPRNEIEALRALELTVRGLKTLSLGSANSISAKAISTIYQLILHHLNRFKSPTTAPKQEASEADGNLIAWAAKQGIKGLIQPAVFEGTGRGGAAATNIKTGDLVLDIPAEAIISEDVALESDLGTALKEIPDMSGETISLLWSIRERVDQTSKYASFFAWLPSTFRTGLGFGSPGLEAIDGTEMAEEIIRAHEHIRQQYNVLIPFLTSKFPALFPAEMYSWDHFLWACQLWYSYGMKVKFPNGRIQTCLVPMASLLNHAVYPHVTHFSRMNESTNTLQLFALRDCKTGEQCFMSYGTLRNSDLLNFYGFVIQDNPYDIIPLELDLQETCEAPQQIALVEKYDVLSSHMMRAFPEFPTRLLAALRVACMEGDDLESSSTDPHKQMISTRNERDVYESLLTTVITLLEPIMQREDSSLTSDAVEWDTRLANEFKEVQKKLLLHLRGVCFAKLTSL